MGNRVAEYRRKAGISQAELAKKAGVSRTTVWALEKGRPTSFMVATLISVADALGASVEDVFFEKKVESI